MPLTLSAVSAPGKVLLAGGYLVLDRAYSGLVFGLSARIHVVSAAPTADHPPGTITVRSPQFAHATWTYAIAPNEDRGVSVSQVGNESRNPFVETTLRYVLSYVGLSTAPASADITILADNDYYSQPASSSSSSTPLPRFNRLDVPLSSAHKTGLGSSAALVTALTACLLHTYTPSTSTSTSTSTITPQVIHNLAQASHCSAQGKVGSGFDVAAAVFGSCQYRRFSPAQLSTISDAGSPNFTRRLTAVIGAPWDLEVVTQRVPPGLRLVMGDVHAGSATPGMVRRILAWRAAEPLPAKTLWEQLHARNTRLAALFDEVRRTAEERADEHSAALETLAKAGVPTDIEEKRGEEKGEGEKDASLRLLKDVAEALQAVRGAVREMGEAAGVAIEPPPQTRLLDAAVQNVPGVLGGVVPGAGGLDAVVFVLVDDEAVVLRLKTFLGAWKFTGEGGGEGKGHGKVVALETREEHYGVRKEDLAQYRAYL